MKHRVISVFGTVLTAMLFVCGCVAVMYTLGCDEISHGNHYFERLPFSWNAIGKSGSIIFLLTCAWYALLLVPWVQYFKTVRKENRFKCTLSGRNTFLSVAFTVTNIALIVGSAMWFIRTGEPDEQGLYADFDTWWRTELLVFMAVTSLVYVPAAIKVVIGNVKYARMLNMETQKDERASRIWHWFVAIFLVLIPANIVFDSWWNMNYSFRQGRSCELKDGKWGFEDRLHRVVIPYMYDYAGNFNEGLACVGIGEKDDMKYGYIDRRGNIVIPFVYDKHGHFIDGTASVKKDGKYGTINKDGKEMIPIIYDWVGFHYKQNKGLVQVKLGDRRGFVRSNGDVVIPISYEDAEYFFCEDLVRVKLYGKWGYLDHKGDVVIPVIYDQADNFKDGRAEVQMDGERFYIDVNGRILNN